MSVLALLRRMRQTLFLLIARDGGPLPSELSATERAFRAKLYQKYPPLVVAVGRIEYLLRTIFGQSEDEANKQVPWATVPAICEGIPESNVIQPTFWDADDDPFTAAALNAQNT